MMRWMALGGVLLLGTGRVHAATIGDLILRPPAPWKPLINPPQVGGGTSLQWNAPNGQELHVDFWPGLPPQPGGAMVVAQKYPVIVAGQKADLIRTSYFREQKADVWVLFLRRGPAWYRLFARHTSRADFEAIVQTARFVK